MTTARQLANLRQNKGRPPKELEREAKRIQKGTLNRELRRLFALAELDFWLREYTAGAIPRSLFLQFVEEGPDRLVKHGLRTLESMTPERRDGFLDRMIADENLRIDAFDLAGQRIEDAKRGQPQTAATDAAHASEGSPASE